jgi:hypothetical protein
MRAFLIAALLVAATALPSQAGVRPVHGVVHGTATASRHIVHGTATVATGIGRGFVCIVTLGTRCRS